MVVAISAHLSPYGSTDTHFIFLNHIITQENLWLSTMNSGSKCHLKSQCQWPTRALSVAGTRRIVFHILFHNEHCVCYLLHLHVRNFQAGSLMCTLPTLQVPLSHANCMCISSIYIHFPVSRHRKTCKCAMVLEHRNPLWHRQNWMLAAHFFTWKK